DVAVLAVRPHDLVVVAAPDLAVGAARAAGPADPDGPGGADGLLTWLARQTWLLREPGSGTRASTAALLAELDIAPLALMVGSDGAVREAGGGGAGRPPGPRRGGAGEPARGGAGRDPGAGHAAAPRLVPGGPPGEPAAPGRPPGAPRAAHWGLLHTRPGGGQMSEAVPVTGVAQAGRDRAWVMTGLTTHAGRPYLCGPALTCACAPEDNLAMHAALYQAQPGAVLVCDGAGSARCALFGELMATDAMNQGLAGLVVHGPVRDIAGLDGLGFPVWCTG